MCVRLGELYCRTFGRQFLKFKNDVRVLFLMLLFKLELCRYFLNLDGYLSTIYENILDGRAPDYLTQKLSSFKFNKLYDTRSRLPYRLPIPRTNSMKRMFFCNAVKLWNVVTSNRDFVCFSSAKKFRKSYFDLIMCKFTPDTFRIDRVF